MFTIRKLRRSILAYAAVLSLLATGAQAQGLYDETILRYFKLTFPDKDWEARLKATYQTENYYTGDLNVGGKVYRNVGVRLRGFTSASIPAGSKKWPLRISMDEFTKDQRLLGYKTLKLNNSQYDPSMVREVLGYRLYRRYIPAPKANFVNVEINGENIGIYQNIQSIDTVFTQEAFGTDRGNRYEAFTKMQTWATLAQYRQWYFLRSKDRGNSFTDLIALFGVYSSTSLTTIESELPKHLAIDHFYRHLAAVMLTGHTDSAIEKDYYLYWDPYTEVFYTEPWDMNLCLRFGSRAHARLSHKVPLQVGVFRERFLAHLRTMVRESLDAKAIVTLAQGYHKLIDSALKADSHKFVTMQEIADSLTKTVQSTPSLESFVKSQLAIMQGIPGFSNVAPDLTGSAHSPANPKDTDPLHFAVSTTGKVQATRVSVFVSAAGRYLETSMFDDGKHGDGGANDGRYGVTLSAQTAGAVVRYYFAAYAGNTVGFFPTTASFRPYEVRVAPNRRSVLIHEFMASNKNGIVDEKSQTEDWLELFNPTSQQVDLSGAWLSDNRYERGHWQLPPKTVLAPGKALLVWADEDLTDGPLHADFKLSKGGEEIALYDKDRRTLLDLVSFGSQSADISTGRLFDRESQWVTYPVPTPAQPNQLQPCGTRSFSDLLPSRHTVVLGNVGSPRIGTQMQVRITSAPASSAIILFFSAAGDRIDLGPLGFSLLVNLKTLFPLTGLSDGNGTLSLRLDIPLRASLVGQPLALQGISHDTTRFVASNGLAIRFCQ